MANMASSRRRPSSSEGPSLGDPIGFSLAGALCWAAMACGLALAGFVL
jgi:hypothetical protein